MNKTTCGYCFREIYFVKASGKWIPFNVADDIRHRCDDTKDYYWIITYPDGGQSGPTRMIGVHERKDAERWAKRQQKVYPDHKIEIVEM